MSNVRGLVGSVTALTLLIGCAAQPPAAPMAAAPMAAAPATVASAVAPVASSGGVDGVYRSPPGGISGNARCGTTRFSYPIRVSGGMASMSSVANGTMEGPVRPDGSLSIEKGRASLTGQFANGQFNGTYGSGGGCAFTLAYAKR
jgi:hypothetical protein